MKSEQEKLKEWVDNWKTTGEFLEKLRIDEMRNGDMFLEISALNSSFREANKNRTPTVTSGLVEFQRLLKKL